MASVSTKRLLVALCDRGGGRVVLGGGQRMLPRRPTESCLRHPRGALRRAANSSVPDDYTMIRKDRLQELLHAEVAYMSTVPIQPVTLREVLATSDPAKLAQFIHEDVPKRFALRIRLIEHLQGWEHVPELADMYDRLVVWFRDMQLAERGENRRMKDFVKLCRHIRVDGKDVVDILTKGIHKLQQKNGGKEGVFSDKFLDEWEDGFLLSRIGTNMLLDQLHACASKEDGGLGRKTGIVDENTDVVKVCRQARDVALHITRQVHPDRPIPICEVESYEADVGYEPSQSCVFTYIPGFLRFMVLEVLKNSIVATMKKIKNDSDLRNRPIKILVCRDEQDIVIKISDRACGIPFVVGDRVWSYQYGAAALLDQGPAATPLSGFGVGLPVSRLHARYLGGKLSLETFPGYGTDVIIVLPKLDVNAKEEILASPGDTWQTDMTSNWVSVMS